MSSYETIILDLYDESWRVRKAEDIYVIQGRGCLVAPHDLAGKWLSIVLYCETSRALTYRLHRVTRCAGYTLLKGTITQRGDTEAVLIVRNDPSRTSPLFIALGLYKRKRYPGRKLAGAAKAARERKEAKK